MRDDLRASGSTIDGRTYRTHGLLVCMLIFGIFGCTDRRELVANAAQQNEIGTDHETLDRTPASKPDEGRQRNVAIVHPFSLRFPAPSLDGGTEWLNTSGEITLQDLRGKIVLLDFWTYCCINCMHVLPDLKYLERKYPKELVIIGVHSAKFDNEKDSENIRQAIMRYEIEHPVINDADMIVWRKMGARGWPTFVIIDAEGNYCVPPTPDGRPISGEGNRRFLDAAIAALIKYHRAKGTLDETPVRFDLEREKLQQTPLKYPGKVLADEAGNRLFIADSNHNRIIVCDLDGHVIDVIGTGGIGAADGAYDRARFDHPQGMELVGETLYVADTENHLIRTVDLKTRSVGTLAGTGQQGYVREGGLLRDTPLSSPWDLIQVNGVLYVAMAGRHQIWSHRLGTGTIDVFAGSGSEDIINGPLPFAAMAQPSGIASDGKFLYVVDSEGSSVRRIPTDPQGDMTTIAGPSDLPQGRSLFEFGDIDQTGSRARLQHPLGVVYSDGGLYVADTYNHKIKKVNLETRRVSTFLGDGTRGNRIDPPRFSEPGGLSIAGNRIYIADTNNHRICVADMRTGHVAQLVLNGLRPPQASARNDRSTASASDRKATQLDAQTAPPGQPVSIEIKFRFPDGFKLNRLRPVMYRLATAAGEPLVPAKLLDKQNRVEVDDTKVSFEIPIEDKAGETTLRLSMTYAFCRDGVGGLCKVDTAEWLLPLTVTRGADPVHIVLDAGEKGPEQDRQSPIIEPAFR